jgi:F-type H+-transporting ATPase subunit b
MDNKILSEIVVQLLGFGVVFLVLKKFAWSSIMGGIETRRRSIENSLLDIEKKKKELIDAEKEYRAKIEHIEQEARAKIQEAAEQGAALGRDIQAKAKADADKMIDRAKAELTNELAQARLALRDDIVNLSGLMTEKVLKEKLDPQAHAKLVDRFISEIGKS